MKDLRNYSLKHHNTFGMEAKASRFMEYANVEDAQQIAAVLRAEQEPFLIIGSGSNLLLTADFEGIVVHSVIKGIEKRPGEDGATLVRCGSGELWDDVVAWCVGEGLGHLVNLSLIPGEVGASVVQNIGAYGSEVSEFVASIEAVDIATGERVTIAPADCDYGYRKSKFKTAWKNKYLITAVEYLLPAETQLNVAYGNIRAELERKGIAHPTADDLRSTIIGIRQNKLPDPAVEGNAGSFFMNPVVPREKYEELAALYEGMPHYDVDDEHVKIPAGWMIEQCGWKGKSLGRAGVHAKQALVLVNRGGATGDEVVRLCEAIRHDVKTQFGIEIFPEVNIV
ncbi:MAG: UDP-N-acetylmuramate dehydrogenase [Prevotella sp.]|nr:UDP-N-acetylmuramate dehydrogenase [Prevotella sp.]